MSVRKFDLVFMSPFSYDFVPAYSQLANWHIGPTSGRSVRALVEQIWHETSTTLDLAADLFDCPIHVHNSAADS
jgi:hypothetical protein